ncbi:MAG TPA: RIP metalloprotease RseP, partial [Bacteroidales bacterium]|nr:RIP metalloprotease RseP [Bacteroidales bacterium]
MTILIKILQFVLSLSILVIIHELGHFTFAKIFKTRVEKFYLFFDPWFSLFKFKKGETEYGVGWLPLGGYVKIAGMIDESMDKEQMKLPPQPYEFRSKSSGQRLLIMIGGVLFNFILAMLIYVLILFAWGETYLPTSNVKYGIVTDSIGHSMGLQNGDKIVSVDNQHIENFYQIFPDIVLNKRKTIQVERDGQALSLDIPQSNIPQMLKGKGQLEPRTPFGPFIIAGFGKGSPAEVAGVKKNDELIALDGKTFHWFDEFQTYLKDNKEREVNLNIKRGTDTLTIAVKPMESGLLGIARAASLDQIFELKTLKYSFL